MMVERPAPLHKHRRRPKWFGWLSAVVIALNLGQLLAMLGAFAPVFSPLIYPRLAPAGWQNITPHGNIILNDFAVSTTTPGLMAACATSFSVDVRDPSTWSLGGFRFWLSHDGGASWQGVHPPLTGGAACEVTLGLDGSAAFTMDYGDGQWASTTTWVTRDSGKSWRRPAPAPVVMVDGQSAPVTPLVVRPGILYGLYTTHDQYGDGALAVSYDNGTTWRPLPTTASALVQQVWRANTKFTEFVDHQVVPDYRGDHWWYRVVSTDGQVPMLEHSLNDGQSWTAVGAIGSEYRGLIVLAVNPAQPDRLCADSGYAQVNPIELRSSADGGQTWREGSMPAAYLHTVGENSWWPVMDAQGNCYTGYHFGRGGPQYEGNDGSYCAVMRLAPEADALQALPAGGYCGLANGDPLQLTYVPAGHGMSGRLVVRGALANGGWAAAAGGLAGETDYDKVMWMAVP
jgi:hypothetical protein